MSSSESGENPKSSSYRKRVLETFKNLGTDPKEWDECEIISRHEDANHVKYNVYRIYGGYTTVTPYWDSLSQEAKDAKIREFEENKENLNSGWYDSCQLCGANIKYARKIKHDAKRLLIDIGSICVKQYTDIGTVAETIRQQEYRTLKEMYVQWKDLTYKLIWDTNKYKKWVAKYQRMGLQKRYHNFQKKLRENDPDEMTITNFRIMFRWARNHNIPIPNTVADILDKKKKIGLDDFL
jgi:hypothetical protein